MIFVVAGCSQKKSEDATTTTTTQPRTVTEIAQSEKQFSTINSLLNESGLSAFLNLKGTYTIFAPTDDAFKDLGEAKVDLIKSSPIYRRSVLLYHAINTGVYMSSDLKDGQKLKAVSGEVLTVSKQGDDIYLITTSGQKAHIVKSDIGSSNGVVHAVDKVLLPKQVANGIKN